MWSNLHSSHNITEYRWLLSQCYFWDLAVNRSTLILTVQKGQWKNVIMAAKPFGKLWVMFYKCKIFFKTFFVPINHHFGCSNDNALSSSETSIYPNRNVTVWNTTTTISDSVWSMLSFSYDPGTNSGKEHLHGHYR